MTRLRGTSSEDLDGLAARFESLVVRVLHAVADAAARLLGATPADVHPEQVSLDDLTVIRGRWAYALDAEVLPALAAVYGQAATELVDGLAAAGRDVAALAAPDAATFVAAARNRLVGVGDGLWEHARDALAEGIRGGEGIDELAVRVRDAAGVSEARARVIARTEALAANNAASLAQVRALGDPTVVKEWLSTPGIGGPAAGCDERTRPTHCAADGQRVRIGERFEVGHARLDFPGDPTGPPDEVVGCRCSSAFDLDDEPPVTASADRTESEHAMADQTDPAEPTQDPAVDPPAEATPAQTGAMVALIPSDADAQRLAVDGGEPAEELHCTLMYLGEAADIPDEARTAIVDAVRSYVDGWPPVEADGFAVSPFNPGDENDRDPCIVLGLSGDDLDMVHDMVGEAVYDVAAEPAGFTLPEQHAPWHAHVTLVYTDDVDMVAQLVDRVGSVTFDRVRVVFADDATDIPLDAPHPDAVVAEPADEGEPVAAAATLQSRMPEHLQQYWIRRLAPMGAESFRRYLRLLHRYEATGRWSGTGRHHTDDGTQFGSSEETTMTTPVPAGVLAGNALDVPPADCPEGQHPDADGQCVPDGEGDPAPTGPVEHYHAIMHVEGVSTGMRRFVPGSLTWRDPPFALHWQRGSSAHSGTPETVQVGNVTRVERDGDTIHGWGPLDLGCAEGLDYARRLVEGFARWVSIGLDESLKESDIEYVWPADAEGDDEDGLLFAEPEEIIFHSGRIAELTAVSIPAQAEAVVEPTQALRDALAEMGVLVAAAVGTHDTATSDASWDADANESRLDSPMPVATAREVYAWIDDARVEGDEVVKDACSFPHHEVGEGGEPGAANLTACSTGIGALHDGRGGTSIPDADRKGTYDHLAAHVVAGGGEPPEFEATPIVAAGYTITIPDLPPAAWFDEPTDMSPHGELRVDEHGRLWGWLAPAGVSHRAFPGKRVQVPMGNVDYSGWMNNAWPVAEGHKIYVGVITMDCGHASINPADRSYVRRREHYDNSCSIAAHARIGERPGYGVWVAGAAAPWLDAERFGKMMSCQLSGDWPPHPDKPGWIDFTASLLVPADGFPKRVPTTSVRVREGALVASAVPVRFVPGGDAGRSPGADLRPALERVARSIGRDAGTRLSVLRDRVRPGRG